MHKSSELENARYKLKQPISQKNLDSILSWRLKRAVEGESWKLGDRQYRDVNAELFFQRLQTAYAKVLWLDLNKKAAIIKEISCSTFPQLTALYLGDNNINSLESLAQIEASNLEKLFLNHNKIVCLKTLRRAYFPQLTELNLNGNFIEEQEALAECYIPKMEKLNINYPTKKQKIFQTVWFMKSDFSENTSIRSNKNKMGSFSRKSFLAQLTEMTQREAQDLFKTFQK